MVDSRLLEAYGGFKVDYSHFWLTRGFYVQAVNIKTRC